MKTGILFACLILAPHVAAGRTLTNGVTVIETYGCDLSPAEFDQDPAQMTPEQFRLFCNQYNARQIADAKVRHQEYLTERGPMPVKRTTVSSGQPELPAGRRLWHGRLWRGRRLSGLLRWRRLWRFRVGWIRAGGGGNNMSNSYTNTTTTMDTTFPDMNDTGGGPTTFINPYCHDYWKQSSHFHLMSPAQPPKPALVLSGAAGLLVGGMRFLWRRRVA